MGGVDIKSVMDFDRLAAGSGPKFQPHPGRGHLWSFYGWLDPANDFVSFIVLPAHAIELDQCGICGTTEPRAEHPGEQRHPRRYPSPQAGHRWSKATTRSPRAAR